MLATDLSGLLYGVARTLVTAAQDLARKKGFKEMEIEIVHAENPTLTRNYSTVGVCN